MTVYSIWDQAAESFAETGFTGTLATNFSLTSSTPLTGIWVYSPSGATPLPAACAIYDVNSMTAVAGTLDNSPSWSGAAGSGWVKRSYNGSVTLTASTSYAVAVFYDSANVAYLDFSSWPVTSGIISASGASSDTGGSIAYPETPAGDFTYWVDVEITTVAPPNVPPVLYSMRTYP